MGFSIPLQILDDILSVMIQNNMNWLEYFTKTVKKAGKRLYMLRLLKRTNADTKTFNYIYHSPAARGRFIYHIEGQFHFGIILFL